MLDRRVAGEVGGAEWEWEGAVGRGGGRWWVHGVGALGVDKRGGRGEHGGRRVRSE